MMPSACIPLFAALGVALALAGCATPGAPLPTVTAVDLDRYAGTWYEIALLPNRFQSRCVADTQAAYRLDGDRLKVVNRCRTADGTIDTATGVARVVPGSGGAKLRVSFFRPFYGDYWILDLDPAYRWALVGEPSRRYAWILARETTLDAATVEQLLARAATLGFNRQAFVRSPHGDADRS